METETRRLCYRSLNEGDEVNPYDENKTERGQDPEKVGGAPMVHPNDLELRLRRWSIVVKGDEWSFRDEE